MIPLARRLLGLAVMICALGVGLAALSGGFVFDVRLTEARLNQTAAAKLPMERRAGPVVWRVDAAHLTVLDGGRLGLDASLHAATSAHEADAHVAGSGVLAYRDGAFWLSDIHVGALDNVVVRKTDEHGPSALGKALGGLVARSETLKAAVDAVKGEALSVALKHSDGVLDGVFAAIPVYRLHDDLRGSLARLALVSLRTDGHDLVATLDPVGHALRIVAVIVVTLSLLYDGLCLLAAFTRWLGGFGDSLLFWW